MLWLALTAVFAAAAALVVWRAVRRAREPRLQARIDGLAVRPRPQNRRAADRPSTRVQPAPPAAEGANNRVALRRRTLLRGWLCTEEGHGVDCVIQNLSATGAAVRVEGALPAGKQLSMIDPSNGFGYTAEVRWRFGARVGLKFLAAFDLRNPQQPQAIVLARELAALKSAA